jgi:hypothetical protein
METHPARTFGEGSAEAGAGAMLAAWPLSALGGTMRTSTLTRNASTCGWHVGVKEHRRPRQSESPQRAHSRTPSMGAALPRENDDSVPENDRRRPWRGRPVGPPAKVGNAASGQIWGSWSDAGAAGEQPSALLRQGAISARPRRPRHVFYSAGRRPYPAAAAGGAKM